MAQATLLFLFVMLEICTALMCELGVINLSLCKNVPPLTRRLERFNTAFLWSTGLWAIAIILMFLLSDLLYLALLSALIHIAAMVSISVAILGPFMERRRLRSQRTESKPA
jgi:ABC-type siderophore export system fused ATPase/permease subunit